MHRGGALGIACGAAVWGLFWIPLRYLNDLGFDDLWAVSLMLLSGLVIGIPIMFLRGNIRENPRMFVLLGLSVGISSVFYFTAFILTDVIRVIFLFYLLPVWALLMSRLFYGTRITLHQTFAICVALVGLWLLLGIENGIPVPHDLGSWFAILSGFFWGLSLALLRGNPEIDPYSTTTAPLIFGSLIAISLAIIFSLFGLHTGFIEQLPTLSPTILLFLLLFGIFVMWPSVYVQVWGARLVPAPTAALMTMSEIIFATLSSWILVGSALTYMQIFGGVVIVCSAILLLRESPS